MNKQESVCLHLSKRYYYEYDAEKTSTQCALEENTKTKPYPILPRALIKTNGYKGLKGLSFPLKPLGNDSTQRSKPQQIIRIPYKLKFKKITW